MSESIVNKEAKSQFWQQIKSFIFSDDEEVFPVWALSGPILLFLTSCILLSFQHVLAGLIGFILSLSILLIYQFRLIGLVISSSLLIYPLFIKASALSGGMKFGFFVSFLLGFWTFLQSLEELFSKKSALMERLTSAIDESKLWNRRFETLTVKHDKLKEEFNEQQEGSFKEKTFLEEEMHSLEALVKEASIDATYMEDQNKALIQEIHDLKEKLANTSQTVIVKEQNIERLEKMLDELNQTRVELYQSKLLEQQEKTELPQIKNEPKKQEKKSPQISGDELLFSFLDLSNNAVENCKKYKDMQSS